jgi:hypothetical protein
MKLPLTLLLALGGLCLHAQESPYTKFGKISAQDFQTKVYSIDSNASAVVLYDQGRNEIEGNRKGWFSSNFTRHKIIRILDKSAYNEADIEVFLYTKDENEEKLTDIKAVTYNLENGKVVETKLEKNGIFKDKKDKNRVVVKFTMPNVKEGSIIEFEYKVLSDYYSQIDPWYFQENIPVLWSEYLFSVPQFFSYTFLSKGYQPFFINDKKDRRNNFMVSEDASAGPTQRTSFSTGVTDYRWVKKDVPAIKEEGFTSTLENHISKIEFSLTSQNDPLTPRDFRHTWPAVTKELLESEYFGKNLSSSNGWLEDEMKVILNGTKTDIEKAKRIYTYVRDVFNCTDFTAISTESSLKNVFKAKKGNVAEINLLLVAMLRYASISAAPVILSRSKYGYTYEIYPGLSRFNYVIAQASVNGQSYFLDASQNLGFGKIPADCYNGHARVVNETATPLYFVPDSLRERKVTALFLNTNDKGGWVGNVSQTPGYFESAVLRKKIKESSQEDFFKGIEKEFGSDVKITNSHIDSLKDYDEPIRIKYEVSMNSEKEDILYINPMFGEGYKKNPFKSAERFYPVEMPYAMDETFILNLQVPADYTVDELPKQVLAKFDEEGKSFFEYRLQHAGNMINLRSRIKMDRTYFEPDEYEGLREFFNLIVKKHNEQIVFKKKK